MKKSELRVITLSLITLLLLALPSARASGKPDIGGYFKSFSVVFDPADFESEYPTEEQPLLGSVTNRLRLNFFHQFENRLSFELAYDLVWRIQDQSLFGNSGFLALIDARSYRIADLDKWIYPSGKRPERGFGILQNLDRALLTIRTGPADILVGRQVIAWGSSRAINPTDVIAPFSFDELDTEDRMGVDALRLRIAVGATGEVDAGYISGRRATLHGSAVFLRSKFCLLDTDLSVVLLDFKDNLLVGADLTRSLGGAGVWLEAANVTEDAFSRHKPRDADNYLRLSAGCDYSPVNGLYTFVEYSFNGAGSGDAESYLDALERTPYTEGAVYFLGKHYLIPGMRYQITPLLSINANVFWNLSDLSVFATPRAEYNISENVYLEAGVFAGIGKNPVIHPQGAKTITKLRSEFGSSPDLYFVSFRAYF